MTLRYAIGLMGLCGVLAMGCNGSDGGGGGSGNNCAAACEVIVPCFNDTVQSCLAQCEGNIQEANDVSAACGTAVNNLAGCLGGLSCEQANAWLDEIPADSFPCKAQEDAVDAC